MQQHQHPEATVVTLLIAAERNPQGLAYDTHIVMERYFSFRDWSADRRADLYARLAERLSPTMTIGQMVPVVSKALWENHYCDAAT